MAGARCCPCLCLNPKILYVDELEFVFYLLFINVTEEYELPVAVFDCGEELDANAPEGLMDVGDNDITYWCPGDKVDVALLQPSFPRGYGSERVLRLNPRCLERLSSSSLMDVNIKPRADRSVFPVWLGMTAWTSARLRDLPSLTSSGNRRLPLSQCVRRENRGRKG